MSRSTRFDGAIFLISFAVLLVELLLTRIFSVTMYYHLSFLAVSLAMLGLGASGLLVHLWPGVFPKERCGLQAGAFALGFAATSALAVGLTFQIPVSLVSSPDNWKNIVLVFALCGVPFFSGGLAIALILTHNAERANRLYFFDLLGAAVACLAFIPLTNLLGAPTAILAAGAVAAAATAILPGPWGARRIGLAGFALFALVAGGNTRWNYFDVKYPKGRPQRPSLVIRWNAFSRVEVNGTPEDLVLGRRPYGAGYSATLGDSVRTREVWLVYDAEAGTQITGFTGDLAAVGYLGFDVSSAAYQMARHKNVLIIGPGGGRDILTAMALGSGPVTGVEINPITIDLMRTEFRDFSGGLYDRIPGISIIHDEGRSFVRRSRDRYGVIQASLVDTWAASAAGAFSLSENSLYTVEAFVDYLDHLAPHGVISFTRWYGAPPVEALRVVSLAKAALERRGILQPRDHIFVVHTESSETQEPPLATILVKRARFTPGELDALRGWADRMRFTVAYSPDQPVSPGAGSLFHALIGPGAEAFVSALPFDLSAVTDDRPFFFDRVPLAAWLVHRLGLPAPRAGQGELTLGGRTLLLALAMTLASMVFLLSIPFAAAVGKALLRPGHKTASAAPRPPLGSTLRWAGYFGCLGLGFIIVEIVLLQRYTLYLGYPVYSLSVVLFTMLASSSLGSLISARWISHSALPRVLLTLCGVLVCYALALPRILSATLGAPPSIRIAMAAATIVPIGLLMGAPFPTGIRLAGREGANLVPWAWAVNGAASVFGSVLCVLISMTDGFSTSFLAGAGAYALAFGIALIITRRVPMAAGQAT